VANETLKEFRITFGNKIRRMIWQLTWSLLYRPTPTFMHGWRRCLLRCFGAHIEAGAHPYPSVRVWAPWNLTMKRHSCLAPHVDCYCVAPVTLEAHAIVSQYSYLCTATHDFRSQAFPLVAAPIVVGAHAWVTADVFIGPGVTVGEGAVVGARSTVVRSVAPWSVVAGPSQREIGLRPPFEIR
jgi:putative colanic acid biosynthesis acetyltransferase WcaF